MFFFVVFLQRRINHRSNFFVLFHDKRYLIEISFLENIIKFSLIDICRLLTNGYDGKTMIYLTRLRYLSAERTYIFSSVRSMIYRLIIEMDWLERYPTWENLCTYHWWRRGEKPMRKRCEISRKREGEEEEQESGEKWFLFCTTDRINGYLNDDQSCWGMIMVRRLSVIDISDDHFNRTNWVTTFWRDYRILVRSVITQENLF